MTSEAYSTVGEFHQLKPEMRKEHCEGFGKVDIVVFYPTKELIGIPDIQATFKSPSAFSKLQQLGRVGFNSFLLLTGMKRLPEFHNLPK
jgi:hypothetical protein